MLVSGDKTAVSSR